MIYQVIIVVLKQIQIGSRYLTQNAILNLKILTTFDGKYY